MQEPQTPTGELRIQAEVMFKLSPGDCTTNEDAMEIAQRM